MAFPFLLRQKGTHALHITVCNHSCGGALRCRPVQALSIKSQLQCCSQPKSCRKGNIGPCLPFHRMLLSALAKNLKAGQCQVHACQQVAMLLTKGFERKGILVMCLQEGDLDSAIKKYKGYLPEDDIMLKFVQIALALHYTHSKVCPLAMHLLSVLMLVHFMFVSHAHALATYQSC